MEFRILGPLEVVTDGRGYRLPAGAERAVFAVLLLNASQVVPASVLVDALWGEDLPANAGNALQGRVSRLRRALSDAGFPESMVVTKRPGYLLDIDPDLVDAHRLVRLVGLARRLAEQASPVEAIERYDEALALWRQDPLVEFATQRWAVAEAARLTELRLSAVEERAELRLAVGRDAELTTELEELTARYPLRERLHALLMRTHYRSGRQADALATYQRLKRTLDDELGLDPSPELRALEQAVLRQDHALAAPTPQTRSHSATVGHAAPGPAPASAPARTTNLPRRLTSFVGRRTELAEVRDLLADNRLVTLTGPGGAGKTSLAMQAAGGLTDRYPDGVWLITLAAVSDPTRLPHVVAATLGVPDGDLPVEERVARYLRERSTLLVLDNCEHLVDAAAALAEALLMRCERLRLLATSREPLAVPGEVQLTVPPLRTPAAGAVADEVVTSEAVRLFTDRAHAAWPAFRLDSTNAAQVAHVCRQLDGIPLAIELAAALVRSLPLPDLADRLADHLGAPLQLLTGGPRTAAARQRTLRATVDWSHNLLSDRQRTLFRRLSIFRGGWAIEAAEQVCAGDGLARSDVVGLLTELVDRSLVVPDHTGHARFRMLETLRHYAGERLTEAGETDHLAAAHAGYYVATVDLAQAGVRGARQGHWLQWLDVERHNVRAVLNYCKERANAEPDPALRLVGGLGWMWYFASHSDGQHDVTAMLDAAAAGSNSARGVALLGHAVVARPRSCIVHPHARCAESARAALPLLEQSGDTYRAALCKALLAVEGIGGNDGPARRLLAEADAEFTRGSDEWGRALVLFVRMELAVAGGALDDATEYADKALTAFKGDHWGTSAVLYHLGLALHRAGRLEQAITTYQSALDAASTVGPANTVQYVLANMGHAALLLGQAQRAEQLFAEADAIARSLGADGSPLGALGEGMVARLRGDPGRAGDRFADALRMSTGPQALDGAALATTGLGFLAEASGDLDSAEYHHRAAWQLAVDAGGAGAAAAAVAIEGLACVAAAREDAGAATSLLARAARWRADRDRPAMPLEQPDIDRAAGRARALLGDDAYRAAFTVAYETPDVSPLRP